MLITNEEFLAKDLLLKRIVLVGGGYIAAEFSHLTAHGCRVQASGEEGQLEIEADFHRSTQRA